MTPYTFYLHERGHEAPSFDFVHCATQDEARSYARMLLRRYPECHEIEIYDGGGWRRRVARREPERASPG